VKPVTDIIILHVVIFLLDRYQFLQLDLKFQCRQLFEKDAFLVFNWHYLCFKLAPSVLGLFAFLVLVLAFQHSTC